MRTSKVCLVCEVPIGELRSVCESCDSTLRTPGNCPNCQVELESQALVGQIVPITERNRACEACGFNFYLPSGLALAIVGAKAGKLPKTKLNCLDIEWLFFAAMDFQMENYGGTIASIDCDQDGYNQYLKQRFISRQNWKEIYWPPEDLASEDQSKFLDLLNKYQDPQLWFAEYVNDADQMISNIEFQSALSLADLDLDIVRSGLLFMLEDTDCQDASWLVELIRRMFTKENYFTY